MLIGKEEIEIKIRYFYVKYILFAAKTLGLLRTNKKSLPLIAISGAQL